MNHKIILFAIISLLFISCVDIDGVVIQTPDFHQKPDGVYHGEYTLGPVKVALDVFMKEGNIDSINLIRHRNGRGRKAEVVLDRVLERQTLDVDVVSGATGSSKALLKAVELALD